MSWGELAQCYCIELSALAIVSETMPTVLRLYGAAGERMERGVYLAIVKTSTAVVSTHTRYTHTHSSRA